MREFDSSQAGDEDAQEAQEADEPQYERRNDNTPKPPISATDNNGSAVSTVPESALLSPAPASLQQRRRSFTDGVKRILNGSNLTSPRCGPTPPINPPPPVVQKVRPSPGKIDLPRSQPKSGTTTGSNTPSTVDSPSVCDSDWGPSPPSSRPPSRPPSRAVSVSRSDGSHVKEHSSGLPPSEQTAHPAPPSRPSSVKSNDGEGKFTLKELLVSGPKLARKSSARSSGGSSRKSDSDRSSDTSSFLKKYGVCERIAIGKGATSVVRLAHKWDRSEEKYYAVKEFRKRRKNETEKEYVKKLTAEFCISSTLHHVNIVETVDLVQDEQKRWCEVMEYCPGGDLYAAIKKGGMSPSEVECCFKQILHGIAYLHGQGVAHRDIKPENLFFDARGHLKIGDYGASTVYRLPWEATVHMSTGLCGSEPYIAPEQFTQKTYDARLVDIWACGIVYYCLHFQELPWRVAQQSDPLYAAYTAACGTSSAASSCPATINNLSPRACRSLLRKMLDPDPKTRYTIEDTIAHSWIQTIEVCTEVTSPSHVHVHAREVLQAHALSAAANRSAYTQ